MEFACFLASQIQHQVSTYLITPRYTDLASGKLPGQLGRMQTSQIRDRPPDRETMHEKLLSNERKRISAEQVEYIRDSLIDKARSPSREVSPQFWLSMLRIDITITALETWREMVLKGIP